MKRQKSEGPAAPPQLQMPAPQGLPRNWDILLEYLRHRRYTSGEVDACIGVSRKVLKDWDVAGMLVKLYQGLGSGRGDERFGKWRLFSIFDIWTLAFYKRLRDVGINMDRLRGLSSGRKSDVFDKTSIQWCFYQALPSWIDRQPFWVHTDLDVDVGSTPIEWHNRAIYFIRIAHVEGTSGDFFLTLNLLPLMDTVMALKGPVQVRLNAEKKLVVEIEGEVLNFEPLPKPE
jgi:hypothetical protein